MKSIATARGGDCLSSEYFTDAIKLQWQCSEGHIWGATPNNIKRGKWCPVCSEGLGERICRLFFQKLFGVEFIKVRPDWLKSSLGFSLELDGYSEELKIAFEHQGRQHYKEISLYSKRKHYDEEKRILCKASGVYLIEIPEVLTDTKIKDLKAFIIQECVKQNILVPIKAKEIEITPLEIFTYTKNEERRRLVEKAKKFIEDKNAILIETNLSDNGIIFKVQCNENHQWNILSYNLFKNKWCPKCAINKRADNKRGTIEEMQDIAKAKGGVCLSDKYKSSQHKLLWQCANKHQWKSIPNRISQGSWCPQCAGNVKGNIEELIQIIEQRGGKCFTTAYENNYSKIKVECENGHKFETVAKLIRNKSWCPQCAIDERAKKKRLSIDDMHLLAKRKQGKCLSTIYSGSNTKLLWQCVNEHQFYSKPGNVHTGYWCPKCAANKIVDNASEERKKQIAQILSDRQGKAFSIDTNFNRKSETTWQCINGHTWKSRIANILDGHWCPRCSNRQNWDSKRTTIQEVKQLAKLKGGDCLSTEYVNALSKLKFKCGEEHTWTAIWSNVKTKGSWCPQCASKNRWDNRRKKESMLTETTML